MTPFKKLGPRPLNLEELVALLDASDYEHLREEDRILPRQLLDRRVEVEGIMDAIEPRCAGQEGDDRRTRLLMQRPDEPDPVQPLEDLNVRALVDRLELAWQQREEEAMQYGLRLGLTLGAHAQAGLADDEESVRPLHLTAVLRAMLDVAEAIDGAKAMREASREERRRQWVASGKTWAEFAMPSIFGPESDEGDEAATA